MRKEVQESLSPNDALILLQEGNKRFLSDTFIDKDHVAKRLETSEGQFPFAVLLSCIDSRVPSNLIFDQGIGDLFNIKIAGNIINKDILGSMEYSCKYAGSKLIVVMSHTKCGAVTAACKGKIKDAKNLSPLLKKIKPAIKTVKTKELGLSKNALIEAVALENVAVSIEKIRKKSPILSKLEKLEKIKIVGASYDITTGKVNFLSL
jgi:carbonic anhydrase